MENKFIAAFFDLDGTLIDTESIHLKAESKCLETFGINTNVLQRPRTCSWGQTTFDLTVFYRG